MEREIGRDVQPQSNLSVRGAKGGHGHRGGTGPLRLLEGE